MAVRFSALRAGRPLPCRKIPGTHFCQRINRPEGHIAAGRIRSIEKYNDFIRNRTRDLQACSIVPQPTTLSHVPPRLSTTLEKYVFPANCKSLVAWAANIWRWDKGSS
jgi:hypothetical protein